MFNKIKKYWSKALSVLCAVVIASLTYISFAFSAFAATSWADVGEDAIAVRDAYFTYFFSSKSSFGDVIKQAADIPISWLKFVESIGWTISPVDDLYYYLNDNDTLTVVSAGGGGHTRNALRGGSGYCRTCRKPAEECTCELFESDASGFDPIISGSDLKCIYTDYSLLYAPMPTPSQYLYNYQSATGKKETGYGFHQFNPYAPVFRYGKGYGADVGQASGWSNGCYILPYLFDDDLNGTYYSWGYWHFYHKTEDNIRYICADYISLADDSDVTHFEQAWNMSEKGASYGLATFANYFALCSYNSDTLYLQCSRSSADYSFLQLSLGRDKFLALNGKITDLVSKSFTSFLQASTFTPQTNTADDWGYIISETPFELFKDQTDFDYNKIPDNYTITITGDTIYDYGITNPDTGKSTTINNYINNNYTIPSDDVGGDDPSNPDSPGSGGNVTVSGNVDVSGKIEIDTKPIDININVNGDSGYSGTGEVPAVKFDEDIGLKNYYDWMQDQTTGFSGFMGSFFSWLPGDIVLMLCAGFALVIVARFLGR